MATTPTEGPDQIIGGNGNDFLRGLGGDDLLSGTNRDNMTSDANGRAGIAIPTLANSDLSADVLLGENGNDTLYGAGGPDTMMGGLGDDLLVGGAGPDLLTGDDGTNFGPAMNPAAGAAGHDVFKLQRWTDSAFNLGGGPDVITDFWPGVDKIDLSWLEKEHAPGFHWNGTGGYSGGQTLEAGYFWNPDGNTIVNIYNAGTRAGVAPGQPASDPFWGPKGPAFGVPTGSIVLLGKHDLLQGDFIWHEGADPVQAPAAPPPPPKVFADEYQAQVVRLYDAAFDRAAEPEGREYWRGVLAAGHTLDNVADFFVTSPEWHNRYGDLDNPHFVGRMYLNVLNRDGEPDGLAAWTGALDGGALDRGDVVVGFSESPEHVSLITASDYLL